ncbi:MAG: thioredoxin domain-containing protein, partial [Phycisphaerales bacterium]
MKVDPVGPGNRLRGSSSPYLLQHARNPVDWWPWCAEAIAEARRRDVPLFVSVGYSTCYWCHVMERETFESAAAAALLNDACVPVKVDREQRPDVDELLMTACQVFTQLTEGRASGGWPLNVFLDPATLEPFFCGTYFPPEPAFGRPSFGDLVRAVGKAWAEDRAGMRDQAHRIADIVRRQMGGTVADAAANPAGLVGGALLYRPTVAVSAASVGATVGAIIAFAVMAGGSLDTAPRVLGHALFASPLEGARPGDGATERDLRQRGAAGA